jgi:hypothetical protein
VTDCTTLPKITRDEAMALEHKTFFTGIPCKHGHVAERHVSSRGCAVCARNTNRAYRKSDPERARANYRKNSKTEYAKDPTKFNQGTMKWRKTKRDNFLKSMKRVYEKQKTTNPKIRMLQNASARARRFNLPYNLTANDIFIPQTCPILGIPLDKRNRDHAPSLDRIVPSRGYVNGNVQVISCRANTIKNNATPEELRKIADFVSKVWKE